MIKDSINCPRVDLWFLSGQFVRDQIPKRPYAATKTGRIFPTALPDVSVEVLESNSFFTSKSVKLLNGDVCHVNHWVLARHGDAGEAPKVFRIEEIINRIGTENTRRSFPDAVLLQFCALGEYAQPSRMPSVKLENRFLLLPIQARLFHTSSIYISHVKMHH